MRYALCTSHQVSTQHFGSSSELEIESSSPVDLGRAVEELRFHLASPVRF